MRLPLLVFFTLLAASSGNYENYRVYRATALNQEDSQFLHDFTENRFDLWKEGRLPGEPTDILVSPEDRWNFETELRNHGLRFEVIVDDVESLLQEEKFERMVARSRNFFGAGSVTFSSFMFFEEHAAYLRRLEQDYPDRVSVEVIGQSYEGRDILMLKLSTGQNVTSPKPAIFIDAGIHCREWIAPPVALYAINQLVENITNSYMSENVDWYIVPNLNPDGYEFTTNVNRLWRKNRRLTDGAACYGTDLNRNFGYMWNTGGASNNSCAETFAGPEAFSEPEARAIRDWFLASGENVKLYLSFHSYGELLLYPWSHAPILPDDTELLYEVGLRAINAIEAASEIGSVYVLNNSAIGLYVASGVTTDWVKGVAGVNLSYIYELPNGDAPYWFMIPARQIRPVVQETWAGIRAMYEYIEEAFVGEDSDDSEDVIDQKDDFILRPFN